MNKTALDIGCGTVMDKQIKAHPEHHWIGLDQADFASFYPAGQFIQQGLDLDLPFDAGAIDFIWCHHVLEHLPPEVPRANDPAYPGPRDYVVHVLNEMWRVLKEGAEAHIIVPWIGHTNAYRHPTHYRFFTPDYFTFFSAGYPGREHLSIQLWSKWQVMRSEVIDQCHVYAVLRCLRWKDVEELFRVYGEKAPYAPWMFHHE